jgi:hypothetical protein
MFAFGDLGSDELVQLRSNAAGDSVGGLPRVTEKFSGYRLHQATGNCQRPLRILAGEQVFDRFESVVQEGVRCGEIERCDLSSRIDQRTCQSVQRVKTAFLQFGELGRCRVHERLLQSGCVLR